MGKYSTNPEVMTKDIGVVAAGTQQASPTIAQPTTTPRTSIFGRSVGAAPSTTDTGSVPRTDPNAMNPAGNCIPHSEGMSPLIMRWQRGYTATHDSMGKLWYCPKGMKPPDPTGPGTDADENTEPGTGLGEFNWPQEMQDLYRLLMSRGNELLDTPGYSDQALGYAFGNDFEKIRQQEAGQREQMEKYQSKAGTLGTGSGAQQMMDLAWGKEGDIATLMRDIFLQNEQQKRADVNQGGGIFNQGMSFAQALEAMNASRRGEGTAAMQQLLQLLQILKGGG
jgi:hypothetical protein